MGNHFTHSIFAHSIRVANLSYRLALLLDLSEKIEKNIYKSGLYHDLGKLKIDPKILNKPGKLTKKEFDYVKNHARYSYEIVLSLGFGINIANNVLYHHENWDGSGYPKGLKGEEIPLASRIIRVADVYDALTSDRPYKNPLDLNKVIKVMEEERKYFDERILNILLKNIANLGVIRFDKQA